VTRLIGALTTALLFSYPAWSTTINAASCSQAHVQAAVDSARDGDTVRVPAGDCTWNAEVSITDKTIVLQGAGSGVGGTKILYGGTNHRLLSVEPGTRTGRMDISGFWFLGGDPDYWNGTVMWLGGPKGWKNLRVHHNVFDGNRQWTIKGYSGTQGLIDHNTFQGTAAGMLFYGDGAEDWSSALTLGTADFLFVEDNIFNFNDDYASTKHPVMDMDEGGRQVFRHNTVTHGLWETHDKARSGLVSANAFEIYSNSFTTSTNQWKGLDVSAGTGVIWGNTFTGDFSYAIGAIDYKTSDPRSVLACDGSDPADQNTPGQTGWRCQYQIGSMGEGVTAYGYPLYTWSNTGNGSAVGMECTAGCGHVQSGRDYINNGSVPKPGYAPYTYPHPLQLGGSGIHRSGAPALSGPVAGSIAVSSWGAQFVLTRAADVKLVAYDMAGRRIGTLVNSRLEAGSHAVSFADRDWSSRVCLVRLVVGERSLVQEAVFLR
jgi:hypothetical protein